MITISATKKMTRPTTNPTISPIFFAIYSSVELPVTETDEDETPTIEPLDNAAPRAALVAAGLADPTTPPEATVEPCLMESKTIDSVLVVFRLEALSSWVT